MGREENGAMACCQQALTGLFSISDQVFSRIVAGKGQEQFGTRRKIGIFENPALLEQRQHLRPHARWDSSYSAILSRIELEGKSDPHQTAIALPRPMITVEPTSSANPTNTKVKVWRLAPRHSFSANPTGWRR